MECAWASGCSEPMPRPRAGSLRVLGHIPGPSSTTLPCFPGAEAGRGCPAQGDSVAEGGQGWGSLGGETGFGSQQEEAAKDPASRRLHHLLLQSQGLGDIQRFYSQSTGGHGPAPCSGWAGRRAVIPGLREPWDSIPAAGEAQVPCSVLG